jgi:predicted phosphodiesterase
VKKYNRVLIISDLHAPYFHPDTVAFLRALKNKYKFDLVVSVGDEIEGASLSFHEKDPDLLSPSDELKSAIQKLQPIYRLFPKMRLVESNHGSLVYRRARFAGLPSSVIKGYREVIEAPRGWVWSNDFTFHCSDGRPVYVCHSKGADVLRVSQSLGMSVIQGHHHEIFAIRYWGNSLGLYWGLQTGCMIDDSALSFRYNKTNLRRPVIGCAGVIKGQPVLFPMILNKNGRWIGEVR